MHKKPFKCFKGEKWNLELAEKMAADFRRVGDNSSKTAELQTYCKYLHKS